MFLTRTFVETDLAAVKALVDRTIGIASDRLSSVQMQCKCRGRSSISCDIT